MAQSLEKRMADVECIIVHLPDDLNARFAGVDVKLATIRETQLLHTQRFSTLARKVEGLDLRMDRLEGRMDGLDGRILAVENRMERMEGKIDLVLQRLPAP